MKRLLVLAALSLAAVPVSAQSASAQSSTVRGFVERVTATTTPKRDRTRPYTFTTKGRIVLPSKLCGVGVVPTVGTGNCIPIRCPAGARDARYCTKPGVSTICTGKVQVRIQKRGITVRSRTVGVRPDCTYKAKLSIGTRRGKGSLRVRARFVGNTVLRPKTSRTSTIRGG